MRRENTAFRQLAVQMQLHIARTFKFFINDIIHSRTGLDQRRRQYRQASAFFHVARRTEKTLRTMECAGSIPPDSVRPDGGTTKL